MKSKLKYDKEFIKNCIDKRRGGMLVEQLYEILPQEQKPNRKYFIELLRSIPGIYVCKYDERMNRFFVTTLHGTEFNKRKLLVMLTAWEMKFNKEASWYKRVTELPGVYRELLKAARINLNQKISNFEPCLLFEDLIWVSYFAGLQKSIFSKRHEVNQDIVMKSNEQETISIGFSRKWGNPYKITDGWYEHEVKDFYIAHFLENNLQDNLYEFLEKKVVIPKGDESYHYDFLNERLKTFDKQTNEFKKFVPYNTGLTLYHLFRNRIFISIVKNKYEGIRGIIFHILDLDDNLTYKKFTKLVALICEFLMFHNMSYPFMINVYCWNEKKSVLYKNRFNIKSNTIRNIKIKSVSRKDEMFESYFKEFRFINLDLDRFLETKGKYYWTRTDNAHLVKYSEKINIIKASES